MRDVVGVFSQKNSHDAPGQDIRLAVVYVRKMSVPVIPEMVARHNRRAIIERNGFLREAQGLRDLVVSAIDAVESGRIRNEEVLNLASAIEEHTQRLSDVYAELRFQLTHPFAMDHLAAMRVAESVEIAINVAEDFVAAMIRRQNARNYAEDTFERIG